MSEYRYSYEQKGPRFYIYDGGDKIAEVTAFNDNAKEIAKNIVYSMNMRDRYLKKNNLKH